jgi:hypothetical protein
MAAECCVATAPPLLFPKVDPERICLPVPDEFPALLRGYLTWRRDAWTSVDFRMVPVKFQHITVLAD